MSEERYGVSVAFEQSDDIGELVKALIPFQRDLGTVARNKEVNVPGKYSFWYAELASLWETVREPLSDNDLVLIQSPSRNAHGASVTTVLAHSSGQWVRGTVNIPVGRQDPQAVGSAITYGRRYGMAAILGIAAEDDDGRKAAQPAKERIEVRQPKTNKPGLLDRLRSVGVHWKDVEKYLQHSAENITDKEETELDEIGRAIYEGQARKEDYFKNPGQKLRDEYEREGLFEDDGGEG